MNVDGIDVTYTDQGTGPTVLLLHGGGGPGTVAGFAGLLAGQARVITPTHPGFEGTPRPDSLTTIAGLAKLYVRLIEELDLRDVTVVGNSMGGWTAAEMALLDSDRLARVVLVDAVGLRIESDPVVDFFSLTPDQVVQLSYYRPEGIRLPEPTPTMIANRAALAVYGGATMDDPTLLGRLPGAHVPALVVWGAADRIVSPTHGRTFARELPNARFELITDAGHLPQLETPETLLKLVTQFQA
jgi:pimeloyl-ACP methyl ester carboxylesterase